MNIRDFKDDIKTGEHAEELFITTFKGVFEPVLEKIQYDLFPQTQRQGVDVLLSKKSVEFDVKVRDYSYYKFKDLLIETISVVEKNKPGWIYYTQSTYITYVWWDKFKSKFIDGYLIYLPHFKSFFEKNLHTFKQPNDAFTYDKTTGSKWHTRNKIVPLSSVPSNCIKHVDMSLLCVKDQLLLSEFFEMNYIKKQASLLEDW